MGLFRKHRSETTSGAAITTTLTTVAMSSDVVAQQRRPFTAAELAPRNLMPPAREEIPALIAECEEKSGM